MTQVKIIKAESLQELENELNEWLFDQDADEEEITESKIKIKLIKYGTMEYVAMVIYSWKNIKSNEKGIAISE